MDFFLPVFYFPIEFNGYWFSFVELEWFCSLKKSVVEISFPSSFYSKKQVKIPWNETRVLSIVTLVLVEMSSLLNCFCVLLLVYSIISGDAKFTELSYCQWRCQVY